MTFREEEDDRIGHLVGPTEPPERHVPQAPLALLALGELGRHVGDREAGGDGIHADLLVCQLLRKRFGKCVDRSTRLGQAVR